MANRNPIRRSSNIVPGSSCPGCSGVGVETNDPSILRCGSCRGFFTPKGAVISQRQMTAVIDTSQVMLAEAGEAGQFYFDLVVNREQGYGCDPVVRRLHGWADVATRRVVQWG